MKREKWLAIERMPPGVRYRLVRVKAGDYYQVFISRPKK